MNLRNVLRAYSNLRQLTDDETALLETLCGMNDSERELLVESLSPQPQKKSSKKAAGKSKRATGMQAQLNTRLAARDRQPDDDDRCAVLRGDLGGTVCGLLPDHNVHHLESVRGYHPFVATAPTAGSPSSANGADGNSTVNSETQPDGVSNAHHAGG